MPVALVAFGPNSVQQICVLFDSMEQGLEYVKEHLGKDRIEITPRKHLNVDGMYIYPNNSLVEDLYEGNQDEVNISAFWTSYYGGCGGVGAFFLADFPTSAPLIRWDLD